MIQKNLEDVLSNVISTCCAILDVPISKRYAKTLFYCLVKLSDIYFLFVDVITSEVDKGIASALQKLSMSSDNANSLGSRNKTKKENDELKKESTAEGDTRKVVCKEVCKANVNKAWESKN